MEHAKLSVEIFSRHQTNNVMMETLHQKTDALTHAQFKMILHVNLIQMSLKAVLAFILEKSQWN